MCRLTAGRIVCVPALAGSGWHFRGFKGGKIRPELGIHVSRRLNRI
jgi:hypothetical protein